MIELSGITKTYGSGATAFQALKGVSFEIQDGEFVAIMGPSGSGKSTLMNILGCLDTPTSGSYRLDGKDVSTLSDDELAKIRSERIGFVFQMFNLLKRTTVLRNVMLPLVYDMNIDTAEREVRARAALEAVGLPVEYEAHLSNELSGGQIQRVAIARALINDPSLILADEPTGNLDTKTGEIVLGTFQKLNAEGRTIVLITHEPDVAEHAKRIIHIRDGAIGADVKNEHPRIARMDGGPTQRS
jgi:putative ABC transport system ATP-binding protein